MFVANSAPPQPSYQFISNPGSAVALRLGIGSPSQYEALNPIGSMTSGQEHAGLLILIFSLQLLPSKVVTVIFVPSSISSVKQQAYTMHLYINLEIHVHTTNI